MINRVDHGRRPSSGSCLALKLVWQLSVALALAATAIVPALADDRVRYAPRIDWNGAYFGGHVGYASIDWDSVFDSSSIGHPRELEDATLGRDFDLDGAVVGLHVGWNRSRGRFVWGIEAEVTYLGVSDRAFDPEDESSSPFMDDGRATDNASVDVNWLASLRGRAGISSGRALFFATAGLAWVDAEYTAQNLDNTAADQGNVSLSGAGFVVGGGIEHALSNHLALRLEGLYYGFNRRRAANGLTTDSDPNDFAELKDIKVARIAVSYSLMPRSEASQVPLGGPAAWSGFYAGGNIGYGLVRLDGIFDASEIADNALDNEDSVLSRFLDLDGAHFGAHFGFNRRLGNYLIGLEADWTHVGTSDLRFDPDGDNSSDDDFAVVDVNWTASLRVRAGWIAARTAYYATAGLAWVDADYTAVDGDAGATSSMALDQVGFVFGGGLQHALSDRLFVRLEGLQYRFGERFDTRNLTPDSDPDDFARLKDISVARISVSYKFSDDR